MQWTEKKRSSMTRGKAGIHAVLLVTLSALCWPLSSDAESGGSGGADWPQWRGAGRDGTSPETGLFVGWSGDGPPVLWRADLGEGFSSVSIAQGRAYTMFAEGVDEFAVCLDAASGTELWRVRIDSKFEEGTGNGPRSTPTVFDGVAYVLSARGRLYAFDAETGDRLWRRNLRKLFGSGLQGWGYAASPLVEGDLLILQPGGGNGRSIAALDRATGEVVWTSFTDGAGYSSPIAVTTDGVRQVICLTAGNLVSVSPRDGAVNWHYPFHDAINIATPVLIPGNRVFVSASYDKGSALVEMRSDGEGDLSVAEVWTTRGMKNWINSSVLHGEYLYGFDNSILKCISVDTGETQWRQRGFGRGSLILADGHLFALSEDGELAAIEATPLEYREKGRFQALTGKCWTAPSLTGGKLYLRSESELICIDLAVPERGI